MTRRPSSASERPRPDRHRSLPILLLAVVAVLAVACGGATTTTSPGGGSPSATSAAPTLDDGSSGSPETSGTPTDEASPTASSEPSPTETPAPSPTDEATPTPATEASATPGPAAACTGNAENRDFYAAVTAAVDWTVYCPVLPGGWFVDSGQYRLANGGRMEIGYHGPGGAKLMLREGSFCTDADGCVPSGSDAGSAAFGDMDGTLIAASDGSWAVVVDQAQRPSWLIEGSGLDQAAFTKIAGALAVVGD
jgi:hypothetical protein